MWYVILDGSVMPIPYRTMKEAMAACDDYKRRLGACICDIKYIV